jgi:hypothetical protein
VLIGSRSAAHSAAEQLFTTTYYDPFYPSLHALTVKPDLLRRSLHTRALAPTLSVAGVRTAVRRDGWARAAHEARFNATVLVRDWQRTAWERWGGPAVDVSWPPT